MLRRSVLFRGANASSRSAIEQQYSKANILSRTSARVAEKLSRRRKIDDLADYVDKELRLEFPPAFNLCMGLFTFALMTPLMYVVCEGIAPPSKLVIVFRAMRQDDYDKLFQYIPWQACSVGHAFIFACFYIFVTPYIRYPFFVHVLAPFFRKMGWSRPREFASGGSAFPGGGPVKKNNNATAVKNTAAASAGAGAAAKKGASGWKSKA